MPSLASLCCLLCYVGWTLRRFGARARVQHKKLAERVTALLHCFPQQRILKNEEGKATQQRNAENPTRDECVKCAQRQSSTVASTGLLYGRSQKGLG
eukprot:6489276-Amphidinium_carterae.1